jgi:hypothetical protein
MADITMCLGTHCDKKEQCYRFTAPKNNFRQSIFTEVPWVDHQGTQICDKFWDNHNHKKDKK